MPKTYITPEVRVISGEKTFMGYFTWMKSRKEIITDLDGGFFMKDLVYSATWLTEVPEEFLVGTEKVTKLDYEKRVNELNLQFNNLEYYVFEINGSCLFRDLLYNVSTGAAWATSNRFLFSILDDEQVYNPEHYHISEEYKDIEMWETQFTTYMEAIKDNRKVDINRLEMPYSVSSYFWYGCSKRTLLSLLTLMKTKMPFFYEIYGKQIVDQLNIPEAELNHSVDSSVQQYFKTEKSSTVEGVERVGDYVYVTSQMSLILYSQFIRQSGAFVQGLFDELVHDNVEEFSQKMFKGSTTFMINFMSHELKLQQTISNRLCAFAMSSGEEPNSWAYFINNFLPDLNGRTLAKNLPCTFHSNLDSNEVKLTNCKYYDDIKFRQEGKEISNCPCPLIDKDMELAQWKKEVDNNKIGDAFYDLTKSLKYGRALDHEFKGTHWTSELSIHTPQALDAASRLNITALLIELESYFDRYDELPKLHKDRLSEYWEYGIDDNITCMMKGYVIDLLAEKLSQKFTHFLINFGGDIYGHDTSSTIEIEDTKFEIKLSGRFSVFTSGNTVKRGHHIVGGPSNEFSTVVKIWDKGQDVNNLVMDIISTKRFAGDYFPVDDLEKIVGSTSQLRFNSQGQLLTSTYCASPFFNEKQTDTRDAMISHFTDVFRPDLTESSKMYDDNHDDFAEAVVEDNISGITESDLLVYPTNTNDLGTLYEVGLALAHGIPVIKYDTKLTVIFNNEDISIDPNEKYVFDCSNKVNAVMLGYASKFVPDSQIHYQLKGSPDNIMLSIKYTHIELENGEYKQIIRDETERDQ